MKKFFFAAALALAVCVTCARASGFQSDGVRVGPAAEEKSAGDASAPARKKGDKQARPSGDSKDERKEEASKKPAERRDADRAEGERVSEKAPNPSTLSTASAATAGNAAGPSATSDAPPKTSAPAPVPVNAPAGATPAGATPSAVTPAEPLTSVYRVGVGDVLDIRLLNDKDPRQSTLYTVLAGGALEYPLLHDPVTVAGMTTEELAAQLIAELRHRGIFQHPQVRVSVREYASHTVLVSGLVGDPGTKILRREAIPLYVIVAEAQPKPEAGRAIVISHATGKATNVDLNDAAGLNALVQAGDVVNLVVRPPEFFYVGGEIGSPGQKDFHSGLTLTQALLASGGVTAQAGARVKVSRAGADGRLVSTEYDLRQIEAGAVPDPQLQAGDRVEVPRAAKGRK
ncbi:MAG: polysaccharide biosynthesis/export family protein [Acidobacteriota bacterium]|nr:polysaccharide biosynthesis/export family protein [Acidobacteriota bacterium]